MELLDQNITRSEQSVGSGYRDGTDRVPIFYLGAPILDSSRIKPRKLYAAAGAEAMEGRAYTFLGQKAGEEIFLPILIFPICS